MGKSAFICAVAALAIGCGSDQKPSGSSSTGGTSTGAYMAGGVTTLAGDGMIGLKDGSSGQAEFFRPQDVASDPTSGDVFVADTGNKCVRMIDASGNVTTLQNAVSFQEPTALAVDTQGYVYVADALGFRIWKLNASGYLDILAGTGTQGDTDGRGGQHGPAQFHAPAGLAIDSAGNVYVADHDRIRKIDTSSNVTTLAGNGTDGFVDGTGGISGQAEFSAPRGLAVDSAGNVYVADSNNNAIRKVDPSGNVTTLAGNGTEGRTNGSGGRSGMAEFFTPSGVAVDGNDNVYVADSSNNVIRRIDPMGNVTIWAGEGNPSFGDSPDPLLAAFSNPYAVRLAAGGGLLVADEVNCRIRLIGP